jgi:hypothetical protein
LSSYLTVHRITVVTGDATRRLTMHPEFVRFMAQERTREFEREAARAVLAADARVAPEPHVDGRGIEIRLGRVADHRALERLAQLEGRRLPRGSFVLAEVDGEVIAAAPLDEDAPALADPFRPTAQLVSLLSLRVAQLHHAERRIVPRLRRRPAAA